MVIIILIYDKKETDFNRNGLAVLNESLVCKIVEKINGEYELELSYPLSSNKSKHIKPFNIIKVEGQIFRIYHTDKDSKNRSITANARHIFYDLYNFIIEDRRAENKTCKEALEIIKEELGVKSSYTFDSDILEKKTQYIVKKNIVEAIFLIVNEWKGELVRDNFNIRIDKDKGKDNGIRIKYGKNIIGISEKLNSDNVATWIYPVGANGITLSEKYLLNPIWEDSEYPNFALIKKVDFKDATSEGMLRIEGEKYLLANAIPDVNYKIDFIQLASTEEYKRYKKLEEVLVGDIVTVSHKILGIDIKVKVIGIERDVLSAKNTRVELGQPLSTLDQYIAEVSRNNLSMASSISQAMSSMLYFTNPSTITVATNEREVIYMPIGITRNTNLMSYLILSINASSVATLSIKYSLDNSEIPTSLKQKLQVGDNLISIPMALVALKEGGHYLSVKLSVDSGGATIMPNGLQLAIDGRNLTGGLSSDVPHAEVKDIVKYLDLSQGKISFNYRIDKMIPITPLVLEEVLYKNISEDKIVESVSIILDEVGD
ncbi:MAG: phage tail spike protein [Miniphocaeibacter sp.]|uniref:phage tail spike protein n=1 Tax=Miniphocaeibacter sp. TaxID=3100973 RepID=UPI0017D9C2F2|nr:hypothetical protein [Gallicola sp.]